ncbi:MAG: cytochrome P450 [bacterium]|nr:cytochrome P450 [bacterium]MDE0290726.1 cytochrome P450 [bacterium]MDE0440030.1 cytochrome P450 [bacterium]
MVHTTDHVKTQTLSLPEELVLMLLNEENGFFHQVPGWDLNCAVVGAVLAELSFRSRIDTDMESLFLLDRTETGDAALDPILEVIAGEPAQRNAQYWIERLAPRAESIIDLTLDHLVDLGILQHHDGGFWTLAHAMGPAGLFNASQDGSGTQFVKTRISQAIFHNEIPDPRDVVIICLINTCDVFRFMFQLDEQTEERIDFICNMDLIGRSIAAAVSHNLAGPLLRRSALAKKIPVVPLRKLLLNPHIRSGNIPALFADLARQYGPVFQLRPPFTEPMIFLAGPATNEWVNRRGRMYLRAKDYFSDFEKVYGANGVLPSLDGADHFRLRKSMAPAYSRRRLASQLDQLYVHMRDHMTEWKVGDAYFATPMCRRMVNAQISPLFVSVDSQDIIDDLMTYKERALNTHIVRVLPQFMLKTPGMRRRAKAVETLLERVQSGHTPAQRSDSPRDLADDFLSLHASDPQFVPESNLRFAFAAALIASVYLGDAVNFALYAMVSQAGLQARVQEEADALFAGGDPQGRDFNPSTIDVTHRLMMESLRIYPIVPMSIRNVMNACLVEGYELPVGSRILIAQTASHYMDDVFPNPFQFDIDRYLSPRLEHNSPGYAPYGLGTHRCLGSRWMELQLTVNVLMVAHYFTLEIAPADFKLKFNPLPSMKPSKKLKFRIVEQRRELPA